ncbi:MAG: hemK [Chitinophagaceae bacterium]|nr:hemK [Chitinophagaceae bacterium]
MSASENKFSKELHQKTVASITVYDERERGAIAFLLLEYILGIEKTDIIANKEIAVSHLKREQLEEAIDRINQSEPVQYITGKTQFHDLTFKVNPSVLIPRPETEELVDIIIKENKGRKGLRIMDMGTGSGCIAVSLAYHLPEAEVLAVDISKSALYVAAENAAINHAKVTFVNDDILNLAETNSTKLDVIVSNPPYVRYSEKKEMQKNVLEYEPKLALFVDDNEALIYYEKIALFSARHLEAGGLLYLEINEMLGKETADLVASFGFNHIEIKNDLFGKPRFIRCSK